MTETLRTYWSIGSTDKRDGLPSWNRALESQRPAAPSQSAQSGQATLDDSAAPYRPAVEMSFRMSRNVRPYHARRPSTQQDRPVPSRRNPFTLRQSHYHLWHAGIRGYRWMRTADGSP